MAEVTERDREAANRMFFLCGSLGDFDAACAFLAEWREARLAEERAARQTMAVAMQEAIDREVDARLKAEGERDQFQRVSLFNKTEAEKHHARAEAAEARLRADIDLRAEVLAGIDREIADANHAQFFPHGRTLTALRHLREIVVLHGPCCGDPEKHDPYSEHVGEVFCAECCKAYYCPTLLSLAPDYAPQALKEMEADRDR